MIEGSGEFQNKDFDNLKNKILFHSINFVSIHFNGFDCPQEVWLKQWKLILITENLCCPILTLLTQQRIMCLSFVTHLGQALKMKSRREHREIYSGAQENKEKIESRTKAKLNRKIIAM